MEDDDDFTLVVRAAPQLSSALAPAPAGAEAPRAQDVALEGFAFDRALHAFNGGEKRRPPPRPAKAELVDAVGRAEDGPWMPMPKDVFEEIKLVSGKTAKADVPAVAAATAAPVVVAAPRAILSSAKTTYLGSKLVDYQNRRFCDARRVPGQPIQYVAGGGGDLSDEEEELLPEVAKMLHVRKKGRAAKKKDAVPGRLLREYGPCSMGLHRVRLWGGLALTAGLDGCVLVWDAARPGDVMGPTACELAGENGAIQSYVGHGGEAVKDCWFASDGQRFASAGFDGSVVLWDTDSGRELARFRGTSGSMNAVRIRPGDDNAILAACGDRKVRHWDARQPPDKAAQTYDYHQSSNVSAVTFCDLGRRFISTGEDKKLLVWDWAVPAPIKIVSETWLPGMPALATHPSSFVVAALGMDSRIAHWRISRQTGKISRANDVTADGFKAAGFACEPCFSPDGDFLACGDGDQGGIWVWRNKKHDKDEKNGVVARLERAHAADSPVASVFWHPLFEGVLMSCGWDGRLKMWGM